MKNTCKFIPQFKILQNVLFWSRIFTLAADLSVYLLQHANVFSLVLTTKTFCLKRVGMTASVPLGFRRLMYGGSFFELLLWFCIKRWCFVDKGSFLQCRGRRQWLNWVNCPFKRAVSSEAFVLVGSVTWLQFKGRKLKPDEEEEGSLVSLHRSCW